MEYNKYCWNIDKYQKLTLYGDLSFNRAFNKRELFWTWFQLLNRYRFR